VEGNTNGRLQKSIAKHGLENLLFCVVELYSVDQKKRYLRKLTNPEPFISSGCAAPCSLFFWGATAPQPKSGRKIVDFDSRNLWVPESNAPVCNPNYSIELSPIPRAMPGAGSGLRSRGGSAPARELNYN